MKQLIRALQPFRRIYGLAVMSAILCGAAALLKVCYASGMADFLDAAVGKGENILHLLAIAVALLLAYVLLYRFSESMFKKCILKAEYILNEKNAESALGMRTGHGQTAGDGCACEHGRVRF